MKLRHRKIIFALLAVTATGTAMGSEIHNAVRSNDVNAVTALIESSEAGIVNAPTSEGITPLHIAAAMNNKQMTGLLISTGADLNARTTSGFTPLHWAASRDAADTAEILIAMGANINTRTDKGITPLHWAASKNATNTVRLLILSGADIRAETDDGLRPLHWAVSKEASSTSTMLLFKEVSDEDTTHGTSHKRKQSASGAAWQSISSEMDQDLTEADFTPPPGTPKAVPGQSLIIHLGNNVDMFFEWIPSLEIWFGKYEVTNEQYKRFKPSHSSMFREEFSLDDKHQPAVFVNWQSANTYCKWLTRNFSSYLPEGFEFRLTRTHEWTVCARCGDQDRIYPWGNSMPPQYGNYSDESLKNHISEWQGIEKYNDGHIVTCSVFESGSNEWGIFGMAGNVWEWCENWYGNAYSYKILRGGSWDYDEEPMIRIDAEGFDRPDTRDDTIGFRVVAAPKSK